MGGFLNWRDTTIYDGSRSAALGAVAARHGEAAQTGAATFAEQMDRRVAREDQLRLNAAIASGQATSGDRRVDANALATAFQTRQKHESDQISAGLLQEGQGLINAGQVTENAQSALDLEQDPELHRQSVLDSKSGRAADKAATRSSNLSSKLDEFKFKNLQETTERETDTREGAISLRNEFERATQEGYDTWISQNVQPGQIPTPVQEQEARLSSQERMQGPEGRRHMFEFSKNQGISEDSWDISWHGRSDTAREVANQELALAARTREAERNADIDRNEKAMLAGSLKYTGVDQNGFRVALSDQELKDQAMGSRDEAISKIGTHLKRINLSQFQNRKNTAERDLITDAMQVFTNSSSLANAIEPYIASDGDVDVEGFYKVINASNRLARWDIINERRKARGMPETRTEEEREATNAPSVSVGDDIYSMLINEATGGILGEDNVASVKDSLGSALPIAASTAGRSAITTAVNAPRTIFSVIKALTSSNEDENEQTKE